MEKESCFNAVVSKDLGNGFIEAVIEPHLSCEGCGACKALMMNTETREIITLKCDLSVEPGDSINYVYTESGELVSSLLIFLLPVLALIAGVGAGAYFKLSESLMLILGVISLFLVFFVLKIIEKQGKFTWMLPVVIKNNGKIPE